MMAHAKLPKIYWVEALTTVSYVINRSPSVPLEGGIPLRVWTGKDVSYRHMRVFDFLVYVHVAKDCRGKLDPKSKPYIVVWDTENKRAPSESNDKERLDETSSHPIES